MLLRETFPELAEELRTGLEAIDEADLAASVESLRVCSRCECGQGDCGTFYTVPKADWKGQRLRQVIPTVHRLMAIDVHEDRIVCVEFLDRHDVVAFLDERLGRVEKRD